MPLLDVGVVAMGEPGMASGESDSRDGGGLRHWRPSSGRNVFTFSPWHERKAPVRPVVPVSGAPFEGS